MTPSLGSMWKLFVFVCIPSFLKLNHNYLSQSPLSTLISCNPKDSPEKALWTTEESAGHFGIDRTADSSIIIAVRGRAYFCASLCFTLEDRHYLFMISSVIRHWKQRINLNACLFQNLKDTENIVCLRSPLTTSELFCMRWPHDTADGDMSQPRSMWGTRHWWVYNICTAFCPYEIELGVK